MTILSSYNRSLFQDFESYLRTETDLVEDDIRLVSDENKSSFITYELEPVFKLSKIFQKLLVTLLNQEMGSLTTQLILNLMTLPGKLK